MELWSIYTAVRYNRAMNIDQLEIDGLRFHTMRNKEGALNLWEILDLPDQARRRRAAVAVAARSS